ncbi:MAG: M28 family peptidase [Candidatus Acidiferrales bacterium]
MALFVAFLAVSCNHGAAEPVASVDASTGAAQSTPAHIAIPASDVAPPASQTGGFDGARAYQQVAKLVSFGPHPSGSAAITKVQDYLHAELASYGCTAEEQAFKAPSPIGDLAMKNVVVKIPGSGPGILLLMTHFDTKRLDNFVGAEDAGSSTGVMLEVARDLCGKPKQPNSVWIAFLDGEETQATFDWVTPDSVYGSRELAARMALSGDLKSVRAVILADMVGQYNLHIQRDYDAPKWLNDTIWNTAARLGYRSIFVAQTTRTEDDNLPFLDRKVPTIDLIDLTDYTNLGYWHTTQDTLDKISPRNLAIVGHVILESVNELQKR